MAKGDEGKKEKGPVKKRKEANADEGGELVGDAYCPS
jgi:hypothetical protein